MGYVNAWSRSEFDNPSSAGGIPSVVISTAELRNHDLNPTTGTWMEQDPAGYVDGGNMYQFEQGDGVKYVDPFGLFITIDKPDTPIGDNGNTFGASVLHALQLLCPAIGARLDGNQVVAVPSTADKDAFCSRLQSHKDGCKLVHDLLNSKRNVHISVGPDEETHGAQVKWDPTFDGPPGVASGPPSYNGNLNPIANLSHELGHSWNTVFGYPKGYLAGYVPDKVPPGWPGGGSPGGMDSWRTENFAVALANAIFGELSGGVYGSRTIYQKGGTDFPLKSPKHDPFSDEHCNCDTFFQQARNGGWGSGTPS